MQEGLEAGKGGGGKRGRGWRPCVCGGRGGGGQAGERREEPLCTRLVRSALCVASVCV